MKGIPAELKSHRRELLQLCFLEFLRGAAILWMAGALTQLAEISLLNRDGEAAPIFPALLFSMSARFVLEYLAGKTAGRLSLEVQRVCRERIHAALCRGRFGSMESGKLLLLALERVESLEDVFRQVLPDLISCVILLPMLLFVMLWLDPLTALIFLVTLPIAPFLLYLIGRVTKERNREAWQEQEKLNEGFHGFLRGAAVLKIFGQVRSAMERLRILSDTSAEAVLRVLQIAFLSAFALELITTLSIALIAVNVGLRLLSGYLDFFPAFFSLLLAPEFYQPIRRGGAAFHAGMKAKEAAEVLREFWGRKPALGKSHVEKIMMPPEVRAEGLSFSYPDRMANVLENVNLTLDPGSTVVLAGASGSGKSTLLTLLAGLAEPQEGRILLNGLPLADMERESLSRCIAYVPQEPHIFQASLRDNLTLFHPAEEERIWSALEEAGLADWAKALPGGLEAEFGGLGGKGLSSGQLHRLGFARALLREPSLVLLDEPTGGLDEEGEQQMLRALEKFCYRRTVLMTAHRRAMLEWAPCIVLLDGGRILDEGRYEDLKEVLP